MMQFAITIITLILSMFYLIIKEHQKRDTYHLYVIDTLTTEVRKLLTVPKISLNKVNLNKINKALKIAASRIDTNTSGYKEILEARQLIEKELE